MRADILLVSRASRPCATVLRYVGRYSGQTSPSAATLASLIKWRCALVSSIRVPIEGRGVPRPTGDTPVIHQVSPAESITILGSFRAGSQGRSDRRPLV